MTLPSLAPGDYMVFAFDRVDGLEYSNADALAPYASRAAHVTLSRSNGSAAVVVADSGPGMSADQVAHGVIGNSASRQLLGEGSLLTYQDDRLVAARAERDGQVADVDVPPADRIGARDDVNDPDGAERRNPVRVVSAGRVEPGVGMRW